MSWNTKLIPRNERFTRATQKIKQSTSRDLIYKRLEFVLQRVDI